MNAIWRRPWQLGAIAPSSPAVARAASSAVPLQGSPTVVELGAGGGAITDVIADRLGGRGHLFAVEINPDLVRHPSASRPWLQVVAGDAAQLTRLLNDAGAGPVDVVVSALPWTLLPQAERWHILGEIQSVLVPGGSMTTITTLTAWPTRSCRMFRQQLREVFSQVQVLGPIWRNLPPAVVLHCQGHRPI